MTSSQQTKERNAAAPCRPLRILVLATVVALFVAAGAVQPAHAAKRRSKPSRKRAKNHSKKRAEKPNPRGVLVLGSSSVNGSLGKRIQLRLEKRGFSVFRRGKSSAGLARPDYFDWLAEVAKLPVTKHSRGAVVYLGTNDGQAIYLRPKERKRLKHRGKWLRWGHDRWNALYQRRVTEFSRALCKAGVWRVVFLTPVDTTDSDLLKRLSVIRRLQYRGARKSRCAWAYSGRGDRKTIRRERTSMPSSKRLRYKDGFHMTERGADVAWSRVEDRVVRYLNKDQPKRLRAKRKTRRKRRSKRLTTKSKQRSHPHKTVASASL